MKKRFSLFNDTDNEPISIGLARLVKFLQPHILFFQIGANLKKFHLIQWSVR